MCTENLKVSYPALLLFQIKTEFQAQLSSAPRSLAMKTWPKRWRQLVVGMLHNCRAQLTSQRTLRASRKHNDVGKREQLQYLQLRQALNAYKHKRKNPL